MTKYYIITGLNEGVEMESYVINSKTDSLDYHLECHGDASRHYAPITKERYLELGGIDCN